MTALYEPTRGAPEADTVDRWHFHHGRYFEHRGKAEAHAGALRELAPDYQQIIRRQQRRYDRENLEGGHDE